ncbi:MAG: EF-hand domain-containing protein [Ramlibacter sp.]
MLHLRKPLRASFNDLGMAGMMNMKDMDTNGDGMISKQEWQAHHIRMWNMTHAKADKSGKIPVADVEAMLKGGPN